MTAIEDNRKEPNFDDKLVKQAIGQLDYIGVERQRMEDLLYNIIFRTKEEAQKEIFDKLEMFEVNIRTRAGHDCLVDLAFIENSLEELKQSLNSPQTSGNLSLDNGDSLNNTNFGKVAEYQMGAVESARVDSSKPSSRKGKGEKQ